MSACCSPARPFTEWPNRAKTIANTADPAGKRGDVVGFAPARTFQGTDKPLLPTDGEGPRRPVKLGAFALEVETVTNARFAAFVGSTGYVTEAESFGWSAVFRGLLPTGSVVTHEAADLPWWTRVDGACWRTPEGPGSSIEGREDHPVTQVSWVDARVFAGWVGGRLPTEAEWEHAARGGLTDPRFPWGDTEPTDQGPLCNIWQGIFPTRNDAIDGYIGTSPVRAFPPNGLGLYDMAGNVWEWTADAFRIRSLSRTSKHRTAAAKTEQLKVLKGGSFLCHKSYCYRYRIAARSSLPPNSGASNVGFRVAYDR